MTRTMTLKQVQQAHRRWDKAVRDKAVARRNLIQAVEEARTSHTLNEIGQTLGMTRQGVYDLLNRNGRK